MIICQLYVGDAPAALVFGGQRMPVGDEEKAFIFVLQLEPVLQDAVIVSQVQGAGRAHAGQDAFGGHGGGDQAVSP
jgi:hypothetical protein